MTTLLDVARAAGVSRATASRVVNGVVPVSQPAAEAVRRAVEMLGYRPNTAARALVTRPACVLADEPTGNLDSKSGASVMELINELHREGRTIIIITHDRELAASLPRRVSMRDGNVESDEGDNVLVSAVAPAADGAATGGAA